MHWHCNVLLTFLSTLCIIVFTICCTNSNSCQYTSGLFRYLTHDSRNNLPVIYMIIMSSAITSLKTGQSWMRMVFHLASCFIWLCGSCPLIYTKEQFASNIHFEILCPIYGKSPGKSSVNGTLTIWLLGALGDSFFIIFPDGWWSACASILCLEVSYWHHSVPRSRAKFFFFNFTFFLSK